MPGRTFQNNYGAEMHLAFRSSLKIRSICIWPTQVLRTCRGMHPVYGAVPAAKSGRKRSNVHQRELINNKKFAKARQRGCTACQLLPVPSAVHSNLSPNSQHINNSAAGKRGFFPSSTATSISRCFLGPSRQVPRSDTRWERCRTPRTASNWVGAKIRIAPATAQLPKSSVFTQETHVYYPLTPQV